MPPDTTTVSSAPFRSKLSIARKAPKSTEGLAAMRGLLCCASRINRRSLARSTQCALRRQLETRCELVHNWASTRGGAYVVSQSAEIARLERPYACSLQRRSFYSFGLTEHPPSK